jgi:hypothetical protein
VVVAGVCCAAALPSRTNAAAKRLRAVEPDLCITPFSHCGLVLGKRRGLLIQF